MATILPRPDVSVSTPADYAGKERLDVTISRDGKSQSYSSEKGRTAEGVKEVVEKIIGDHKTAEFLP